MPKYRLLLARFPYGGIEHSDGVDWLLDFCYSIAADKRFELLRKKRDDTPITMTRNWMIEYAKKVNADFILSIDADMVPDCEIGFDPRAKPFWNSSIEFLLDHPGPCLIAAPYCGPPPHENIYVFHWTNLQSHVPKGELGGLNISQYTREHAYVMGGIQEVAALPTGLILYDMRAFKKLQPPYFSYEYNGDGPACSACGCAKPGIQAEKISTEDVVLTRDMNLVGVKQYCNWDAWAGHRKWKTVRKPQPYTVDGVAAKIRDAVVNRVTMGDRLNEIRSERFAAEIAKAEAEFVFEPETKFERAVPLPPLQGEPMKPADLFALEQVNGEVGK